MNWNHSEQQATILNDLKSGFLSLDPTETSAEVAWNDWYKKLPAFRHVEFEQFSKQLKAHRQQVERENAKIQQACEAYEHDRKLHPVRTHDDRGRLIFSRSPAALLLKEDLSHGYLDNFSMSELWELRPEYQVFSLHEFRRRIYQENNLQKFYNYLELQRKEKAEKKATRFAKRAAELDKIHGREDDMEE